MSKYRGRAFLLCGGAYFTALVGAGIALRIAGDTHPLRAALLADLTATAVVFTFSFVNGNSSLYDPYWSVAPPLLCLYWLLAARPGTVGLRHLVVLLLVALWAARLTSNWARRWRGLGHEDWRYRELRRRFPRAYWAVSFLGVHLMPTVVVFLGCLALFAVFASPGGPLSPLDGAATLVTAAAIVLETAADRQLDLFRRRSRPGEVLSSGLWRFSRHPNYLGECLFWWGLFLFALAASPSWWWAAAGPATVTALFVAVSVPMMDRHLLRQRPGYRAQMERTPALLGLRRRAPPPGEGRKGSGT